MEIRIRQCESEDLYLLRDLAEQTFTQTFGAMNTPENMQAYTQTAFNSRRMASDLNSPTSDFFFIYVDDELAGYLKTNLPAAQTDLQIPDTLEVERIYVRQEFQGLGLGKRLIQQAFELAQKKKLKAIWLGVWEKNEKAIGFYQAMGFRKVDTHSFLLGDDQQTDWIMQFDFV